LIIYFENPKYHKFKEENYEGFYFSNKIVFYRISSVYEYNHLRDRSKNDILKEIEALDQEFDRINQDYENEKAKYQNKRIIKIDNNDFSDNAIQIRNLFKKFRYNDYLKGLELAEQFSDSNLKVRAIEKLNEAYEAAKELNEFTFTIENDDFSEIANYFRKLNDDTLHSIEELYKLRNHLYLKKRNLLEKALLIIDNLGKPHKIEVTFKELKYLINGKQGIKLIGNDQENEYDLNRFYNNVKLTRKYQKNKTQIIDFLNSKIKEAKSYSIN
jgi:hypothetical protein